MDCIKQDKKTKQNKKQKTKQKQKTKKQKNKKTKTKTKKKKTGMTSATEAGRMAIDPKAWHNIMDQMTRQSEEDALVPTP